MAKLCDQDRKRQNAMVKMEIKHVKTQNVLKRKMEEAVAINKRLKVGITYLRTNLTCNTSNV